MRRTFHSSQPLYTAHSLIRHGGITEQHADKGSRCSQVFSAAMSVNPPPSANSMMLGRLRLRRKKPRPRMGVTAKTYRRSSSMTQDVVAVTESVCNSSAAQRSVTSVWRRTRTSSVIRAVATRFSKTRSPQDW